MMKVSYYAVARGWKTGVFSTWTQCEKNVLNFPNARFKKFSTISEAERFVENNNREKHAKTLINTINKKKDAQVQGEIINTSTSSVSSIKVNQMENKKIMCPEFKTIKGIPVVYTDGACSKNGRQGAKAGIGVFWGDGHPDNVAAPIRGRATNNRAEYSAAIQAMEKALERGFRSLVIRTDCRLLIKSMTLWLKRWKLNGWRTKTGTKVENQDLLERIESLMQRIDVQFEKVMGHSDDYGNCQADLLAREGAILYKSG